MRKENQCEEDGAYKKKGGKKSEVPHRRRGDEKEAEEGTHSSDVSRSERLDDIRKGVAGGITLPDMGDEMQRIIRKDTQLCL